MPSVLDNEKIKNQEIVKPSKMYRVERVRLFESGNHKGIIYEKKDIDDAVNNFNAFSTPEVHKLEVPIVLGHEEAQVLLDMTGHPAAGWIESVWAELEGIEEPFIDDNGNVKWRQREAYFLYGNFYKVPEDVAQWIVDGAYRYLSCEFSKREKPPAGVPAIGPMLLRVAILGATQPHVKSLGPLPSPIPDYSVNLFSDSDSAACDIVTLLLPIKGATCFSEDKAMNDAMMNALAAQGIPPEACKVLASIDPAKYASVGKAFSEAGNPQPPQPGGQTGTFDRAATIEKLSALPNADRDAIGKMSDDELKSMYSKSKFADGGGNNAPGNNDVANPGTGGNGTQKPSFAADDKKDDQKFSVINQKTKELESEMIEFRKWRQSTEGKLNAEAKQRADAEYAATCKEIDKFCTDQVAAFRITAREAPLHANAMKEMAKLPTFKTDVVKFSDDKGKEVTGNPVEAYKATILARSVMKFSQDRIVSPAPGGKELTRAQRMIAGSRIGKDIAEMNRKKAATATK